MLVPQAAAAAIDKSGKADGKHTTHFRSNTGPQGSCFCLLMTWRGKTSSKPTFKHPPTKIRWRQPISETWRKFMFRVLLAVTVEREDGSICFTCFHDNFNREKKNLYFLTKHIKDTSYFLSVYAVSAFVLVQFFAAGLISLVVPENFYHCLLMQKKQNKENKHLSIQSTLCHHFSARRAFWNFRKFVGAYTPVSSAILVKKKGGVGERTFLFFLMD